MNLSVLSSRVSHKGLTTKIRTVINNFRIDSGVLGLSFVSVTSGIWRSEIHMVTDRLTRTEKRPRSP